MFDKKTILLAYHERKVRNVLRHKLKPNYDLLFAEDGVQAVRVYESHAERIATIVIELRLPKLNGRAVTQWVHHILPDLPVIISGSVIDPDLKELLANPSVRFIQKPLRLSELTQLLHETVGRRAPPESSS
ncbi:MAG TPA: response regulator [Pyrinomonadaceae bacterium]|nr:response regulator [Pyrinomonadaceae bacterium]